MKRLLPFLLISPLLAEEPKPTMEAIDALNFPGVKVNLEEKAIDVTASICLTEGSLEFIACTKETKEHESILRVEGKPSHIHTALLLLGAKPGNPAMRKMVGSEETPRWIDIPPRGHSTTVSLVITDKEGKVTERPISDFVSFVDYEANPEDPPRRDSKKQLASFLFAGSHLYGKEGAPKVYLADNIGSVISLFTFGDELLCLPGIHLKENYALQWEANPKHLPKVGTKVIMRLRPVPPGKDPKK